MTILQRIFVLLVILLLAFPMNGTASSTTISKHEYGLSETIRLRIYLDDDETGYRITITDPNGRTTRFERYDLESDETYTIRLTASRPTGRRDIVTRSYDDDGDRVDTDRLHYHVLRMPQGPPVEDKPAGSSEEPY